MKSRLAALTACIMILGGACTSSDDATVATSRPSTTVTTTSSAVATTATSSTSATTSTSQPPWTPPSHPIQVENGRFVDTRTGSVFVVRGTNYLTRVRVGGGYQDRTFSPEVFDRAAVGRDFATLADRGYNTVRIFLDSCSGGPSCIARVDGEGLNGAYLDVIAEVIELARSHGLFLILTSNDLPDDGGYARRSSQDDAGLFPGYRNTLVMTESGEAAAVDYWDDLLGGLVERRAAFDAVLGWSILNEQWMFTDQYPLAPGSGVVTTKTGTYDTSDPDQARAMVADGVRSFVAAISAVIESHDPDGMVTMGFFAPQFPHPTAIGGDWYVDTASLVDDSALDFFDFHAYPGEDISLAEMAENFGLPADKPVVMGEVGAFIERYPDIDRAARVVQRWIAESCDLGWRGWLYWEMLPADLSVGDATWALTAEDGLLLDALAPGNQPDPCVPTLPEPNLAFGKAASASRSLADEPPTAAVDGDPVTQWGAGTDAPQWIEIDLGESLEIGSLNLIVAQFPAGPTVHRVSVDGATVATLEGRTAGGDTIRVVLDEPVRGQVVRITTVSSPSWVAWSEIEILAPG